MITGSRPEIWGYGTIESYPKEKDKRFTCPLKDIAAVLVGTNSTAATDTDCKKTCAWWNYAAGHCGIIR